KRVRGVFFNTRSVEPSIGGGTCSAMSFDYIDQFLRQKTCFKSSFEVLKNIGPRYRVSSQEFMNQQAAFNTISKHPQEASPDFKCGKIAAMLKLFDREVGHCSEEIQIDAPDAYKKILKNINALPKGIFAVRALAYANNTKEEREGHTLAFINQIDGQFFYD